MSREGKVFVGGKKRKEIYMALLICMWFSVLPASLANAQPVKADCADSLKEAQQTLRKLHSEFSTCRSVKITELENFNAKRDRYLRLITWASSLEFAASLKPYMNALNERDRLLSSKADGFEACVPPLRDIVVANSIPQDSNQPCDQPLANMQLEISELSGDLKICQGCSLGVLGEGINKSAMELLIAQQKDARVLRQALYQQLQSDKVGFLSELNQWLITRDVFLAYVTDTALQQSNTQKLIVMLEHLEQQLETVDTPSEFTDKVVQVYHQLAKTLQSKPGHRRENAEHLLDMFVEVVPQYASTDTPARYAGFNDTLEMAQRFNAMSPQERDALVSAINSAVKKYQPYNRSS